MNLLRRASIVALSLLLVACLDNESAPSDLPANFTVTEGENRVVLSWDVKPDRTYWIFYKRGTNTDLDNFDDILVDVNPPYVVSGLVNDTQYAFAVTSSKDGSEVGPFSPVVTATPRLLGPGVAWTIGASLSANNLRSIAFAGNNYVAVGDAATVFVGPYNYTSDGGVTAWGQPASLPVAAPVNLTSVLYDGTSFVALGDDGSVMKSTDTETWEAAIAIVGPPAMHALAVGASAYVAVGDTGAIYTNTTAGITAAWTAQTSGTVNDLYGVSYVNGRFIAVGESGTLLTSTDGVTWTTQISGTNNSLRQVAFGANTYVAVGDAGTIVSSTDATTWSAQGIPTTESYRAIRFGPDAQFIAVGTTGTLAYSATGEDGSWAVSSAGSIDLNSLASNLVYIAVGDGGANVSAK